MTDHDPQHPNPNAELQSEPSLSVGDGPAVDARSAQKARALQKARRMVVWTVGSLVIFMIVALVVMPSQFMEMRWSVLLKLAAGVLGTILLSAGLMAASFYSDESGHDDDVPGV